MKRIGCTGVIAAGELCLTRADTEAYCAALGQHYIRDETNDQDVYARNRITQQQYLMSLRRVACGAPVR